MTRIVYFLAFKKSSGFKQNSFLDFLILRIEKQSGLRYRQKLQLHSKSVYFCIELILQLLKNQSLKFFPKFFSLKQKSSHMILSNHREIRPVGNEKRSHLCL